MNQLYSFKIMNDGCMFDSRGQEVFGVDVKYFDAITQKDGTIALVRKETAAERLQRLLPDSLWAKAAPLKTN